MRTVTVISAVLASVGVANAQVKYVNGTFICPKDLPNGAFCAGTSLETGIIIRCTNGVGQPGRCSNNLVGQPPVGLGVPARCWELKPDSGIAACEKNCIVYGSSGTVEGDLTLPFDICQPLYPPLPSSSSSSSSSSSKEKPSHTTTPKPPHSTKVKTTTETDHYTKTKHYTKTYNHTDTYTKTKTYHSEPSKPPHTWTKTKTWHYHNTTHTYTKTKPHHPSKPTGHVTKTKTTTTTTAHTTTTLYTGPKTPTPPTTTAPFTAIATAGADSHFQRVGSASAALVIGLAVLVAVFL
ncbi:hypothetical protein QBC35DRAFT_62189 [Podospora australis]|uniref:Uncharacterized protein n=1 Tax=Podospora australis TaxID=1536484 RepID=A0AAN7AL29_9PEZI|nr:hypothetical protein QBC35DRAFT_62189 [Podospora australis]